MDGAAIAALVTAGAGLVTAAGALWRVRGTARESTVTGYSSLVKDLRFEVAELRREHEKCKADLAVLRAAIGR